MKTIALANQKGGVGKTTTAASLGVGLAQQGKKVLLVDADAQGNLTQMLGWRQPDELSPTLADLMTKTVNEEPVAPGEGILHHASGVDLVPANIELSGLEVTLVNIMSRETVLRQYLSGLAAAYDYAIIDCMPSLGMLTINALTAADSVIIPVQGQYLAAKGLEQLMRTIARVKRQINPHLTVDGILLTMMDSHTTLAREVSEQLRRNYGSRVFSSEIPHTYKEFKAPDGYVLDDTAYSAVLNKNGQVLKVTRENTPVKGGIEILKVDADTKQPLAGVVFRLFDANGSKIADGTTDAGGKVTFSNLRLGKYFYQEISTVDGYVLDETRYDFSLTTTNLSIKVTRENVVAKGSITVRKVDATGAPLAGAELVLETSTDGKTWTEIGRVTTDKTGVTKWSDLKLGVQYRITEVKAPAGYTLLTEALFTGTLDTNNRDITITACNNAGFVLPFTGGTGFTTYILFAALALMAGVYFCKKSDFMKETTK